MRALDRPVHIVRNILEKGRPVGIGTSEVGEDGADLSLVGVGGIGDVWIDRVAGSVLSRDVLDPESCVKGEGEEGKREEVGDARG